MVIKHHNDSQKHKDYVKAIGGQSSLLSLSTKRHWKIEQRYISLHLAEHNPPLLTTADRFTKSRKLNYNYS